MIKNAKSFTENALKLSGKDAIMTGIGISMKGLFA